MCTLGDLPGYGTVWYHPTGIANILSLSRAINIFTITYDSANGNEFRMHKENGEDRLFRQSENGLYFWNARTFNQKEVVLINNVENNSSKYSTRDYSQAKIARKLQRTIGRPSYKGYQTIIIKKRPKNCPLMVEDVKAAEHIFVPETGCLTGKTVKRTGIAVRTNLANLPFEILERYQSVTLSGDIMWINGIRFFKHNPATSGSS